ncbi:MAG: cation:proton antiporter, partial [Myxococcota bacterium]
MRRLVVLLVALGLLLLLQRAAPPGAGEVDPGTLAAVGFVVLAAFTVGELGGQLGLPRITGYILCGVGLGPQIWDLLSRSVVDDMKVFNTLALGLIALTAGLELDLGAIRKVAITLLATLVAKLPLLLLLVGGTAFGLELAFGFLQLQSTEAQLVVALILAILGIGTSPAIVLAVSNEARAKGRLTDLILALAVVKDLVVVVSLAVGLALGAAVLGGEGGFDPHVLVHVGEELGGSLLVGAGIGGLLVAYLRFVHQEMLLVVLVVVLVGAEVAHALHLELLLVFITAGFVVKNFSGFGEKLHHPLERVALPVFVVFFTTAGATVDLEASFALLPLAGALVLARMLAFFLAGRFGAWLGGEEAPVRNWAWLGYWPQAGITLGLVTLAAKKLPQLSVALQETGFAVVALNLLAGPIMVGWALRGSGEASTEAEPEETSPDATLEMETEIEETQVTQAFPRPEMAEEVPPFLPQLPTLLETEPLVSTVEALARDLEGEAEAFLTRTVSPLTEQTHELLIRMLDEPLVTVGVRRALSDQTEPHAPQWQDDLEGLRVRLVERLVKLPARLVAPLSQALLVPRPSDGPLTRFGRWRLRAVRRLRHSGGRTRAVRLRVIARYVLEPRIASALRAISDAHYDHHAHALDAVRSVIAGERDAETARVALEAICEQWVEAVRRELLGRLREGFVELAELASEAGAPGARASQLRLSNIQSQLVSDIEAARRDTRRWQRVAAAGRATLRAEALVEEAQAVLSGALRLRVREPLALVRERLLPVADGIVKRLESIHEELREGPQEAVDLEATLAKVSASLPKPERRRLGRARAAFGRLTRRARLPDDLARLRGAAPERLELLPPGTVRDAHARPERVNIPTLPFAERMEFAIANLIGQVRDAMAPAEALILASDGRLRDATHLAAYGVEAAHTWETEPEARQATALRALARGQEAVERFAEELGQATDGAETAASEAIEKVQGNLQALIQQPRAGAVRRVRRSFRVRGAAMRSAVSRSLSRGRKTLARAQRRLGELLDLVPAPEPAPDAAAVGRALTTSPLARPDLPPIYRKVFDLEPGEDRRLAAARETEVTAVLAALE